LKENIIPQWAFRLNSAKADVELGFYVFEGTIKNKSKITDMEI
jgi:hypothetical protein